jgi:hypothetical protein
MNRPTSTLFTLVLLFAANAFAEGKAAKNSAREPLTHRDSGIYGWWQPYFWEGPFDFLIVQAFVRPHESLDAVQNAGHMEGIRLWKENLMKARAAGKRVIAQATPGQGGKKTDEYYQGLVRFLENVNRSELYAVTLSEENIFWNGEHEKLTEFYYRLKKQFPDMPIYQWYSNSSRGDAWPGFLYPWLPADGWIIDEYYAEPRDFEQEVRRYRMLGLPLIQLGYAAPVEAAKHPTTSYHPSMLQGQLRVARKYNVPFAYYCWEGGMPKRTFAWAETAEEASKVVFKFVLEEADKARHAKEDELVQWDMNHPVDTVLQADTNGIFRHREDFKLRMNPREQGANPDFMARSLIRGLRFMKWAPDPGRIIVRSVDANPVDASMTCRWATPGGESCRFRARAKVEIEPEAKLEVIFEVSANGYDWVARTGRIENKILTVDLQDVHTHVYTRLRIAGISAKPGAQIAAIDWIEVSGTIAGQ